MSEKNEQGVNNSQFSLSGQDADFNLPRNKHEARTYRFISEALLALTHEENYESAMNGMLRMVARVVKPGRLSIFECAGQQTKNTFELCGEGVVPQSGTVHPLPAVIVKKWFKNYLKDPVVIVSDTERIKKVSVALYEWCKENDITQMMAAPFFSDGEVVGFLGAYNCEIDTEVDLNLIFSAISTFIGARIDNRRLIEDLDWTGKHDALTGLLNRRGSELAIQEFLQQRPNDSYVLALVDLDDFKKVNDLFGHAVGDEALRAIGRAFKETFPEDSIVCRNGGDEFMALFPGKDVDHIAQLIEDFVRAGVEFGVEEDKHRMTMSVGFACFPQDAATYEDLYMKADAALYVVKFAGKAGFRRYSPEVDSQRRSFFGFVPHDIAENLPCSMMVHVADESGEILFANRELIRLFGCENAGEFLEFSGSSVNGLLDPAYQQQVTDKLVDFVHTRKNRSKLSLDFCIVDKNGTRRQVFARIRLVDIEGSGKAFYTILYH